jgi:hypothetical protein
MAKHDFNDKRHALDYASQLRHSGYVATVKEVYLKGFAGGEIRQYRVYSYRK